MCVISPKLVISINKDGVQRGARRGNVIASMDRNNVDMSWIIAVGQFEGRELWADDSEGDVSMTVTKKRRGHRS